MKAKLKRVNEALTLIENEMEKHKKGEAEFSSLDQLVRFKENLTNLHSYYEGSTSNNNYYSVGRIVVDSWPFTNLLGKALLEIEQELDL